MSNDAIVVPPIKKNPDLVAAYDVDDCLILWDWEYQNDSIYFDGQWGLPHHEHVSDLKQRSLTHKILVWSQNGEDYAKHIIERMGLQKFVDVYLTKPYVMFDDLPATEWSKRMFIKKDQPPKVEET